MKRPSLMRAPEQPVTTDIHIADDVFMKTMRVALVGTLIPQHSHSYAHTSVLVRGAVRLFKHGVFCRDYHAPDSILIAARVKHTFQTLEPDTIVLCVHDVGKSDGEVAIHEEHHLVEADVLGED